MPHLLPAPLTPSAPAPPPGESAGLRVPQAGVLPNAADSPAWAAYGCVLQTHVSRYVAPPRGLPRPYRGAPRPVLRPDGRLLGVELKAGEEAEEAARELKK